jgi:hypothetical protein
MQHGAHFRTENGHSELFTLSAIRLSGDCNLNFLISRSIRSSAWSEVFDSTVFSGHDGSLARVLALAARRRLRDGTDWH